MYSVKNFFSILSLGLLLLSGCNVQDIDLANLEKPTIKSNSAVPLGHASFTMGELISEINDGKLNVQEDSESKLIFNYKDTIEFSSAGDLIDIPTISDTFNIALPATPVSGSDVTIPLSATVALPYQPTNNELLTEIFYKAGEVSFSIESSYSNTYTATLNSTTNVNSGAAISFTESSTAPQNLANHKTSFVYNSVAEKNEFSVDVAMNIVLPAGQEISEGESVQMVVAFSNQEFSLVRGNFGQDTIKLGDRLMSIDFFEELGKSGLYFNDPEFSFRFVNGFGVPLGIDFGSFFGISTSDGSVDTTRIEGAITKTLSVIPAADETSGAGELQQTVNNTNSTIQNLLSKSPGKIGIGLEAQTNVDNKDGSNFFTDESRIVTYVDATIPLSVKLDEVTKNVGLNLGGGLKFDEADSLTLRIITVNEIPFNIDFELEIWDENDSILFVSPQVPSIRSAKLNPDNSFQKATKSVIDVPISKAGIEAMNIGKKLNFRLSISTPRSQNSEIIFVNILANYAFDIQVSASGTLNVDL